MITDRHWTTRSPITNEAWVFQFPRIIVQDLIDNGNRTEWSPIGSVIIRVITKLDDREAGVQFINHEYVYRPTSDETESHYQLIISITIPIASVRLRASVQLML